VPMEDENNMFDHVFSLRHLVKVIRHIHAQAAFNPEERVLGASTHDF